MTAARDEFNSGSMRKLASYLRPNLSPASPTATWRAVRPPKAPENYRRSTQSASGCRVSDDPEPGPGIWRVPGEPSIRVPGGWPNRYRQRPALWRSPRDGGTSGIHLGGGSASAHVAHPLTILW